MSHQRLDDANADVTVMLSTSVSTLNVLCMVMRSILQLCLLLLKVLRKQASRLCVMILRDEQQQDALPEEQLFALAKTVRCSAQSFSARSILQSDIAS
jgi:hypothetical protein